MNAVIFLDIDGVLNSESFLHDCGDAWDGNQIDPKAVARLNRLVRKTDASIVVSSSWRLSPDGVYDVAYLQALLNGFGVVAQVVGVTPYLPSADRAAEIDSWLSDHPDVKNFVILDDDRLHAQRDVDDPCLADRFVRTSWANGLQDRHVDKALCVLGFIDASYAALASAP